MPTQLNCTIFYSVKNAKLVSTFGPCSHYENVEYLTMRNSTIDGRFRMPGSEIPHCVCIQAMALPRSSLATTEHDQETPAAHSWEMQSSSCKTGGLHAVLTKLSYNLSSLCPSQGSDLNHHLSFRVSLPIFPHRNLSWEISFMSNCIMVHVSHRTEINIV